MYARVKARSGGACGVVDAPLTLSCRHAQANVEAASNNGMTALMRSAQEGHDACLRQLLAAQVRACVPCDHVPADLRRPGWMAVCACCNRDTCEEDRADSSVARQMRAFGGVYMCVPG